MTQQPKANGKMANFHKHPDVFAWEAWCESPEGKLCPANTASGQYLENRLWRAFMEGRKSCRQIQ